jgi:hypothetical protein
MSRLDADAPKRNAVLILTFSPNTFTGLSSVSFGIDRDFFGDGGGNSADLLEGAKVSAITTQETLSGVFVNIYGSGFSLADGLIDAVKAANAVP